MVLQWVQRRSDVSDFGGMEIGQGDWSSCRNREVAIEEAAHFYGRLLMVEIFVIQSDCTVNSIRTWIFFIYYYSV